MYSRIGADPCGVPAYPVWTRVARLRAWIEALKRTRRLRTRSVRTYPEGFAAARRTLVVRCHAASAWGLPIMSVAQPWRLFAVGTLALQVLVQTAATCDTATLAVSSSSVDLARPNATLGMRRGCPDAALCDHAAAVFETCQCHKEASFHIPVCNRRLTHRCALHIGSDAPCLFGRVQPSCRHGWRESRQHAALSMARARRWRATRPRQTTAPTDAPPW